MGYNIGPKIGIEGESEFRNQIKKINAEYKTLEAETRAVTAAFEKNGDEQGKLEATTKQLEKQIDKQKQKMSLLEDALQKATEKFGEESTEANRLRGVLYDTQATVSKLEGALDDARQELGKTGDAMEEFSEETDDAGDAALDFGDILAGNFVADIAADAVQDLTDKLVEFAKESIEVAAEVKASNAQMEQTFVGVEEEASRALDRLEAKTGITSTRMQDRFTKLYAFAKVSGMDAAQSLSLTERAMSAAADSAAYYDKSMEDAAETLQSFLKGNYANDAALGISATETTRNAEANRLYAQSFKELSEAQKVDVLLSMVEAGNKAAGALGQAAREADSWTNVTGEAAETIRQIQAAAGEPALEMMIPIVQGFTEALKELLEVSDLEALNRSIDNLQQSMDAVNAETATTIEETDEITRTAEAYVNRLREMENAGLDSNQAQYNYKRIVEDLNTLIPSLNLTIDENTGLLTKNANAILVDIAAWAKSSAASAFGRKLEQQTEALGTAEMGLYEARYKLSNLQEDAKGIEADLAAKSEELAAAEAELAAAEAEVAEEQKKMQGQMTQAGASSYAVASGFNAATQRADELRENVNRLTDEHNSLQYALQSNHDQQDAMNASIAEGEQLTAQYSQQLQETADIMAEYGQATQDADDAQAKRQEQMQNLQAELDEISAAYNSAKDSAIESLNSQIGLFDEIATKSDWSAEKIIKNWEAQQHAFDNYSVNLQKAVDMGLDAALVQQLSDGSHESMQILDALVNDTEISIDEINAAFRGMSEARNTTANTMAEIETDFSDHWARIEKLAKDAGLNIVDGAVVSIDNNAYKLSKAMRRLAKEAIDAYEVAFDINSPSRVMEHETEFVVDGAVVAIDRNVADFEAAMERMAFAGRDSYVNAQLARADDYPTFYSPAVQPVDRGPSYTRHYGGFNIQIYQQPGQSADDLVDIMMDRIQTLVESKEAGL